MLRRRSRRLLMGLVVAAGLLPVANSGAHDSLAPPGASHNWLPSELWVYAHWVPFDEQALYDALGLDERSLEAYLYNDHHRLAGAAVFRGMSADQLADRLTAGWDSADADRRALLRDRTLHVLTQGH